MLFRSNEAINTISANNCNSSIKSGINLNIPVLSNACDENGYNNSYFCDYQTSNIMPIMIVNQ